jgi:hypothetical protein
MNFPLWEAFVAAGAGPEELLKLEQGAYPVPFQAKIIAWHNIHRVVKMNEQDAVERASTRKNKAK